MLRNSVQSSMQKTYNDCYLICSTAVYYEAQVSPWLITLDEALLWTCMHLQDYVNR